MTQQPTAGQPPAEREFEPPVAWLLGQQLLAGIKWIALYASYGEKLDARDWMRAEPVPRFKDEKGDEFWFDYIADSGDGQKAVYNIAYLCQGDLWLPQAGSQPGAGIVSLKAVDNGYRLPRGQFLLVGGDTAYHIADYETLADRFRKPLNWAYDDRCSAGETPSRTYIYGIPGNHDYYDALDGFNRQFLAPITPPTAAGSSGTISLYDQLKLEGFDREQKASYVALDLPHDWKLWALDAQDGDLDKRQQAFFLGTCEDGVVPKKLIVATPEPVTEFGKHKEPDAEIVQAYMSLGLEPAFTRAAQRRAGGRPMPSRYLGGRPPLRPLLGDRGPEAIRFRTIGKRSSELCRAGGGRWWRLPACLPYRRGTGPACSDISAPRGLAQPHAQKAAQSVQYL